MRVELHADVGEDDVGDFGAVPVLNIHGDVSRSDYVGVFEADILHLGGGGLGAELHGAAPVAPDHVVAQEDILRALGVFFQPVDRYGSVY